MPMVFHQIFANLMTSWGSFGCFRAAKLLANRYVRNSSSSRFLSPLLAIVLWSKMNELSLSMSKIFEKLYCKIIVVTLYCIGNTKNHPSMKKSGPLQNYYGDRSLLLVVQLECFMEAIAGFSPPSFSAVYSSLGSLAFLCSSRAHEIRSEMNNYALLLIFDHITIFFENFADETGIVPPYRETPGLQQVSQIKRVSSKRIGTSNTVHVTLLLTFVFLIFVEQWATYVQGIG